MRPSCPNREARRQETQKISGKRIIPPEVLYHGTVERFLASIREVGLVRGNRHHVHLSKNIETARRVGARRGKPVVLTVDARGMHRDGHKFFVSANGVWLTDSVPPGYLSGL